MGMVSGLVELTVCAHSRAKDLSSGKKEGAFEPFILLAPRSLERSSW